MLRTRGKRSLFYFRVGAQNAHGTLQRLRIKWSVCCPRVVRFGIATPNKDITSTKTLFLHPTEYIDRAPVFKKDGFKQHTRLNAPLLKQMTYVGDN